MLRRLREPILVLLGFAGLTVVFTYPLAFRLGSLGRTDNADGQFAIWNVAWVARTLVVDPLHVFDANIFYPHRWTLAYSETNLGSGLAALPVYWLTGSPYIAFNFTLLASFIASGTGTYYLVRHLTSDRRAAVASGIAFAFCPYLFGHIPHIQLLMTAGLPFCLLAFHRLVEQPTFGRAAALGLAMTAQTLFCAYYGVFAMLIVGYAVLFTLAWRRTWRDRRFVLAVAVAACVALVTTLPLAIPYLLVQSETGFVRSVEAAREYAASWRAYFASNAYVHGQMMRMMGGAGELLFPGFVALGFALFGTGRAWRRNRSTEFVLLYLTLALLAFWTSLGPAAGLYRVLYETVPGFTLMRAPSRFGVIVTFALSVLAGFGIAFFLSKRSRPALIGTAIIVITITELMVPLRLTSVPAPEPAYQVLATLPRGPVIDLPVYSHPFRFLRARYMLGSTIHWMPIVVAYSDFIPQDFMDSMNVLADFPSVHAFERLERDRVRYAVFHLDQYGSESARDGLLARIDQFSEHLRPLHKDGRTLLYEIVEYPR